MMSVLALAASGAFVASTGAYAAQVDNPPSTIRDVALVGPSIGIGSPENQRDVIEPPSSIDPGMTLDPPQTGAKMPIIHPPGMPNHGMILPR